MIELFGSWLNNIQIKDLRTGKVSMVWEEPPLIANAALQYYFYKDSIYLNYLSAEMHGVVAPTDSRFRMDQRLFEEGQIDEADDEKILIEEEQRRKRKEMKAGEKWEPNFFRKVDHPYLKDNTIVDTLEEKPIFYELVEDSPDGYWERRKRGDWSGMPSLFGPFPEKLWEQIR